VGIRLNNLSLSKRGGEVTIRADFGRYTLLEIGNLQLTIVLQRKSDCDLDLSRMMKTFFNRPISRL
jgi:hypothetical protein